MMYTSLVWNFSLVSPVIGQDFHLVVGVQRLEDSADLVPVETVCMAMPRFVSPSRGR